jgi:hypothetical protein
MKLLGPAAVIMKLLGPQDGMAEYGHDHRNS